MKKKIQILQGGLLFLLLLLTGSPQSHAQTLVCDGEPVFLVISSHRGTVQWEESNDGTTYAAVPGGTSDTLMVSASGSKWYRAGVSDGNCPVIYSDTSYVIGSPLPVADAGADLSSCIGGTVTLGGNPAASSGTPPYQYLWTPATGLSNPAVANPSLSPSVPQDFVLTITDSVGCVAMDTVSVDTGGGGGVPGTQTFAFTGQVDQFIIPACIYSIDIESWGAQGGGGSNNGGKGAYIKGTVAVIPGDTLLIMVGEIGQTDYGYGGGGGTFVALAGNTPLVIAGGGGGAEHGDNFPGYDALTSNSGQSIQNATGGSNGSGGQLGDPNTSGCGWSGSGGGGFLGNGGVSAAGGGFSFVNGGAGGTDHAANCVVAGRGGYGGGGASGNPGGGGGGYSGGAGGANIGLVPDRGGGGGGSFNIGTNQTNTSGVNSGNGQVILSW